MARLSAIVQERLPEIRGRLSAQPLPSRDIPAVPLPVQDGRPVTIGQDVSSIVFLHSCRKRGRNAPAYSATWNYADTAELLGWYEAVYEDGFVATIPIRYGVNILEEGWLESAPPRSVAYEAALSPLAQGKANFAYEWINPRFGKTIREVRWHSAGDANPVRLSGLQIVPKRVPPETARQ